MRKLGYYHTYRHRAHEASIDLAEKLIQIAPVPMSKVLFQCSGSEANDTAIKLAWYYQAALGRPQKNKIIGAAAAITATPLPRSAYPASPTCTPTSACRCR